MVQTALVTGVTGYIGSHVAKALLAEGWHVKGTVRDATKAAFLHEAFKEHGNAFATVTVPDMTEADAFKAVLTASPIDVIFHVASPFTIHPKDPYKDLLEPAVNRPSFCLLLFTTCVYVCVFLKNGRLVLESGNVECTGSGQTVWWCDPQACDLDLFHGGHHATASRRQRLQMDGVGLE